MGVILTPLLGSCAADDVVGDAGRDGCDIILDPAITVTSVTKAVDGRTSSNQFETGEEVWLWAMKKGTSTEYIKAWQLKANGSGGFTSVNSSAKYWPSDGSALEVYALHGNFKNSTITEGSPSWSNLSLTHTVETNQTSPENKRLSDLLYSHPTMAAAPNNTVQLAFDHLLAKITVKLDLYNSKGITASDLSNATVKLTNILTTGIFNSSDVNNIITSGVNANTSGSREDIKAGIITQPSDMTSTDYEVGSAIVPLQNFGGKNDASQDNVITIMLTDGRSFSYKPTSYVALSAGKEYTYTLRIIGKKITGSLSVSEFSSEDKPISFKDYFDYLADLKNRAYLGNPDAPHDLSYDYNGQMNTANCYVVTHPGYYKFPLVYGNAIKNGAPNAIAYGVKDGTSISSTFVNHLGNPISDPYIYKNTNCTVGSAELVWQDAQNLISNNIALCDNDTYISFQITKENIQQGNAVIAVKDESRNIMWSWHIWVTNKNVYETQAVTASYNSQTKTFMFMPFPLGWNDSTTAPTCTFYQWGRKDPFPPSDGSSFISTTDKKVYKYDDSGNSSTENCWYKVGSQATIANSILNPSTFYFGYANWCSQSSNELWNVGEDDYNVDFETITKSVYDPSPAGFRLPETAAFTGFTVNGKNEGTPNGSWESSTCGYNFTTGSVTTYWQECGYREYNSGSLNDVGSWGYYWSAGPSKPTDGRHLNFRSGLVDPQSNFKRAYGVSVRPVSE